MGPFIARVSVSNKLNCCGSASCVPSGRTDTSQTKAVASKTAFLWQRFPKFVLGFLTVSACATAGVFTKPELVDVANLSRWAFLLTFAGVGLRTDIRQMSKQGFWPFIVGAAGEFAIALIPLAMVIVVSRIAIA
jgi:uncharacterized membrane protein YadS